MRYYIRQRNTYVSGPHDVSSIRQWIKQGKVRSEMEFSLDREDWMWGIEVALLFPPPRERRAAPRRRR